MPRDLDTIVRQAMASDPDDRFQTVQAMAAALSRSATGPDGAPVGELLPVPPPTGLEATPPRGFLRHEGRLLGWVLALVAMAAILVAVGLTLAKDDLGNLFGEDPPADPRKPDDHRQRQPHPGRRRVRLRPARGRGRARRGRPERGRREHRQHVGDRPLPERLWEA